jgi:hypothetical protein
MTRNGVHGLMWYEGKAWKVAIEIDSSRRSNSWKKLVAADADLCL